MTKAEGGKPAQAPSLKPTPRSPPAAAIRTRITATSTRRSITPPRCSTGPPRIISPSKGQYSYGRRGTPTSEALEKAIQEIEGPACAAVALLPSGLAAISTALLAVLKAGDHVLVTDSVYGPTRKFCDTVLSALRRDDHLLRSADRRGHRRADAAEHPRRVHRDARLADVRDAGHPGHRRGRAPARRAGADGQHLGRPALFQGAGKGRRPGDPVRHQIHRRPFRPDARHRLRQQGRPRSGSRTPPTRWASASGRTT